MDERLASEWPEEHPRAEVLVTFEPLAQWTQTGRRWNPSRSLEA